MVLIGVSKPRLSGLCCHVVVVALVLGEQCSASVNVVTFLLIASAVSRLCTKWFSMTRLETRTKESNICASIWVFKTLMRNESEGCFATEVRTFLRGGARSTDLAYYKKDLSKSISVGTRKMVIYA